MKRPDGQISEVLDEKGLPSMDDMKVVAAWLAHVEAENKRLRSTLAVLQVMAAKSSIPNTMSATILSALEGS